MIQASVRLYHPAQANRWIDESPINVWLNKNFGPGESLRTVNYKTAAWYVEHEREYLEYHFVREQDAVLFSLRWK